IAAQRAEERHVNPRVGVEHAARSELAIRQRFAEAARADDAARKEVLAARIATRGQQARWRDTILGDGEEAGLDRHARRRSVFGSNVGHGRATYRATP